MRALAKLKKTIKRHNREHPDVAGLHLLRVPCMDICPKRAITICLPASQGTKLSLLREENEIDELYQRAQGRNDLRLLKK
jgi:hypothetical protein